MLIIGFVNKIDFELLIGHDKQNIISKELPFDDSLFEYDLLIGFFAHISDIPDEYGVLGLFDL